MPAAPRFALTFLYASQTSRFAMPNGFAPSLQFIPRLVVRKKGLDNATPSLNALSCIIIATTGCSAPVLRIGTLSLERSAPLAFFLNIAATGSHVPYESPMHAHAASIPDAAWPGNRLPPSLFQDIGTILVSTSSYRVSIRHQQFAFAHLRTSYLTKSSLRLFQQRSPPGLFIQAACGGLEPAPIGRFRGAFPHLSHSLRDTLPTPRHPDRGDRLPRPGVAHFCAPTARASESLALH